MLFEHALLPSGDIAESGAMYAGWPARMLDQRRDSDATLCSMSTDVDKAGSVSVMEKGGSISSAEKV